MEAGGVNATPPWAPLFGAWLGANGARSRPRGVWPDSAHFGFCFFRAHTRPSLLAYDEFPTNLSSGARPGVLLFGLCRFRMRTGSHVSTMSNGSEQASGFHREDVSEVSEKIPELSVLARKRQSHSEVAEQIFTASSRVSWLEYLSGHWGIDIFATIVGKHPA